MNLWFFLSPVSDYVISLLLALVNSECYFFCELFVSNKILRSFVSFDNVHIFIIICVNFAEGFYTQIP